MKTIRIFSESAAIGRRLREILYLADGAEEIELSDFSAIPEDKPETILIVYAKSNIPAVFRNLGQYRCPVILLLNPDCYAMYLDRARHAGITLLLMPVAPYMLLDAVRSAAIS